MARRILFRPRAADDALEARGWYAARATGLGERFVDDLESVVARILERPAMFPLVHGRIRRAVLSRFPYAVYFRDEPDEIVILALHGRQDPRRWQSRS